MKDNPYPGLASFESNNWPFYGRDRDITALTNLLITNRTVLLHSPSGAGKSSLIHKGLIPELDKLGTFQVLPVLRVNENLWELKRAWEETYNKEFIETDWNRFTWSILRSLESKNKGEKYSPLELANLTISNYLENTAWIYSNSSPKLLIFDQFEEVITKRWRDVSAKERFFYDIGKTLRNSSYWALFVVREDYVAALQPYYQFLPTSIPQEYRMELLEPRDAKDAIEKPAKEQSITFEKEAIIKLLKLLSAYKRFDLEDKEQLYYGKWIVPLFLQLVCHRLWSALPENTKEIKVEHIPNGLNDLAQSLAYYYSNALEKISNGDILQQRKYRTYIGNKLINVQRMHRRQIEINLTAPNTLDNFEATLIKGLKNENFICETRPGTNIYELAHDRMMFPILEDNANWIEDNISWFERRINKWKEYNKKSEYLLKSWKQVTKAIVWLKEKDKNQTGKKFEEQILALLESKQQKK